MAAAHLERCVHRQKTLNRSAENPPLILLTSGEPAGIGPDICLKLASEDIAARLAVLGDPALFEVRARQLGIRLAIEIVSELSQTPAHETGSVQVLPVPLATKVTPGNLDAANAAGVISMLDLAAAACLDGSADAMVTAPVQKSIINEAGFVFSGHTEHLAGLTGTDRSVMMLASPRLRVVLATTHLPLAEVSAAITKDSLTATLRIVDQDLKRLFGLAEPRLMILGLNPHAGENGVLGNEEQLTIAPVIAELAAAGLAVFGPVSADSAFTPDSLARCDVVIAMYHDQGLPVLKAQDFGDIVNVTLGLPIIRTSVDHGTALPLAGTGRARHESLRSAVELAIKLAERQSG